MSDVSVGSRPVTGRLGDLVRFRNTAAYDRFARIPLILWFLFCGLAMARHLSMDIETAHGFGMEIVLKMLARVAGLGFVVLFAVVLSVRLRPVARSAGLLPRLAALGGTFSVTTLALFPAVNMSSVIAGLSLVLTSLGNGLACYALVHLGRSASMMAEARRLVTSGPYRLVRHPLYAAEAVASLGLLLQFLSTTAIVVWGCHISLQLYRIRYEERILRQAFPEYGDYARRVARVLPGLY